MAQNELLRAIPDSYLVATIAGIILSTPVFLGYKAICASILKELHKPPSIKLFNTSFYSVMVSPFGVIAVFSVVVANLLWHKFGYSLQLFVAMSFAYPLLLLAAIDFKTQILPDVITKPLIALGVLQGFFGIFTDVQSSLVGALAGYWILWSVNFCFRKLRGIDGMGYGDFKLLSAIGAWAGIKMIPMAILLSSVTGIFVSLIILKVTKNNLRTPTPFGPALVFTGFIAFMYGNDIMNWYLAMLQGN